MKGRHPSRAPSPLRRARLRTACSVLAVTFVMLLASACNGLAFGRNVDGRLGDGTKTDLHCCGSNAHGQLGNGTTVDASVPTRVGSSRDWREVDVGERHTCGIRSDNVLRCWGRNANGQVGDGTFTDGKTPTLVQGGGAWEMVRLGGSHTCAIRLENSRAMCWGAGAFGARGDGTNLDRNFPVPVQTEHTAQYLALGRNRTVVLRTL